MKNSVGFDESTENIVYQPSSTEPRVINDNNSLAAVLIDNAHAGILEVVAYIRPVQSEPESTKFTSTGPKKRKGNAAGDGKRQKKKAKGSKCGVNDESDTVDNGSNGKKTGGPSIGRRSSRLRKKKEKVSWKLKL